MKIARVRKLLVVRERENAYLKSSIISLASYMYTVFLGEILRNVEEKRRLIINLLGENGYVVDELEGAILASKYCLRQEGAVRCFLVEAASPYEHLRVWGGLPKSDPEAEGILTELNEKLLLLN